ncbi:MAG: HAD hydrolase-like protein [Streptosporangiaceae bacterium]
MSGSRGRSARLLVLWDVDFTLVNATGVGRNLYQAAFAEVFGRVLPASAGAASMAGRTDRAIALDVLRMAGVPDPRTEVVAFETALARLGRGAHGMVAESGKALAGAHAALGALAEVPGVVQSVLTGNVSPVAEAKLAPLGLAVHLDLAIGAYGNEHEVRAELVPLARERAAAAYRADFSGEATVLVGDTPLDVAAALAAGARAVGVATGQFAAAELEAAGAGAVLDDLTATADVVAAVLGNADRYQPRPA